MSEGAIKLDAHRPLNGGKGAVTAPIDPRLKAAKSLALAHASDAVRALVRNLKAAPRNAGSVNTAAKLLLQFCEGAIPDDGGGTEQAVKLVLVDRSQFQEELAKRVAGR